MVGMVRWAPIKEGTGSDEWSWARRRLAVMASVVGRVIEKVGVWWKGAGGQLVREVEVVAM